MQRSLFSVAVLSLALGCGEQPSAFPVPSGSAAAIVLDVRLPVPVLGTWVVDGFSETLRLELAKYHIAVADRPSPATPLARIDLGEITYRRWQEVDVAVAYEGKTTPLGRIQVPDLEVTTLDVAAQPVAELIARWVWSPGERSVGTRQESAKNRAAALEAGRRPQGLRVCPSSSAD